MVVGSLKFLIRIGGRGLKIIFLSTHSLNIGLYLYLPNLITLPNFALIFYAWCWGLQCHGVVMAAIIIAIHDEDEGLTT